MNLPTPSPLPSPAWLTPEALGQSAQQAVDELLREGESANTLNSYRAALRYWAAWHRLRFGQDIGLPVAVVVVQQFIVDHAQRSTAQGLKSELPAELDALLVQAGQKGKLGPFAHNTLVHRVAVLSKIHQMRGVANPCHDPQVRELMSRTRKACAKRGDLPQKKAALTKDPLQALLATCDASLQGTRDRALLLFAWASGGRRRSEVAGADMRFLRQVAPGAYLYTLAHSKTNRAGTDRPDNQKPITGTAGEALAAWLAVSGITQGPVFRRLHKGGALGESLSAASVSAIVKKRCALAGIEGDFSAHSLRSGFVTEAGRKNVPLADTMALTGHRSVATVMGYFRAESALNSPAARLMDD